MNPCPLAGDQGSLPLDDGLKKVVRTVGFEPTLSSASGWGLCQVGLRAVVAGVVGIEPTISWLRTRCIRHLGHTPLVDPAGLEPATSCVQNRRSSSLS